MASLSPEERRQLARAAAAARWQQAPDAPKLAPSLASRHDQSLVSRLHRERTALLQQRQVLDRRIAGLTQALEGYGINLSHDSIDATVTGS
jgi:hypothetical protein